MAGRASGLISQTHRRFRRCGRPVQRAVRRRAGAPKAALFCCRDVKVDKLHVTDLPQHPVDACASNSAAAAAGALLRRITNVGPEASLCEVAEKWGHLCELAAVQAETSRPAARRVQFAAHDVQSVHEITPYSEIYGLHPREFVFGKNFCMIPSGGEFGFVDFLTACQRDKPSSIGDGHVDEANDDSYESDSEEEVW